MKKTITGTISIVALVMFAALAQQPIEWLKVGGGYGNTGIDLQSDGDVLINGDLTVDGTITGTAANATEFADDVFRIQDNGDATKQIAFQASTIATGTTRTISMPDTDVDLAAIAVNTAKVTNATHTGDVAGSTTLVIQPGAVDIAMINATSGGTGKYLKWDGTWTTPAGSGDMVLASEQTNTGAKSFDDDTFILNGATSGSTTIHAADEAGATDITFPASTGTVALTTDIPADADDVDDTSTTNKFATAGQLAKVDHLTVTADINLDALASGLSGAGDVDGPGSSTDNAIPRFDSTSGKVLQGSGVTIDDSDNIGNVGTVDGRDVAADGTKLDTIEEGAEVNTVTPTNTVTLTNKRITKRKAALTDAATIAVNSDGFDIGTVTLAGDRTLGADTGTPTDLQMMLLRVTQDGTGDQTLAYTDAAGGYAFPDTAPTLSTTAGAIDYMIFVYHESDDRWHFLDISKGH